MSLSILKYLCFLCLIVCGSHAFGESTKKTNWRDIGCSKESMDVRPSPNAKKIHLKANLTCHQRARLLGFDKSECDKCKTSSKNKSASKSNKPPKDGTTTGSVDGGAEDGSTDESTDGDTDTTDGDKKNGNNGHGNDKDGNDSSNPGNSNNGDGTDDDGSAGNGKGKGTSK